VGKIHHCKACEDKRLEKREREVVDSWRCVLYEDSPSAPWCKYDKIPSEKRMDSVCLSCDRFKEFEREMDEEEVREAEFFEAVERDPDAYLRVRFSDD